MYWGDASVNLLNRANLDGTSPQIPFLNLGPQNCDVRDVDVDEAAGQVYFTCGYHGPGRIMRVKTDGTGLATLVTNLNFPWPSF